MRILQVLTYYRPHTSGLTIYVERLAKALTARGHEVTVLTSRYHPSLPLEERFERLRIVRVPVLLRISKGVIMPTFGWQATRLVAQHDVVHLHLPQFDAAGVAVRGRLTQKPTLITYHCDLALPPSPFNAIVNKIVDFMNHLAAFNTHAIVSYTQDFVDHSPFLQNYLDKVVVIPPPVDLPPAAKEEVHDFAKQYIVDEHDEKRSPVIGMAARLAAEKGVQVLLDALPAVLNRFPRALVLFAGQYRDVLSEGEYYRSLESKLQHYQAQGVWKFLGVLNPQQMASFYPNLDVLVVPSLNSTESFGLVQIEAMMNGVPVIASNLPGVRQPVRMTGMGEIAEVGDAQSLAQALLRVLGEPSRYTADPQEIRQRFSPASAAEAYETLYCNIQRAIKNKEM